ncbi:hypothetical protein EI77_01516 [Prosthecobacter fusiformis]|uniref:Heavy-metal resistance protein n=1 Tax=Prosthecobacter fusiformis TaxID=48464 RepID=A0A4R7S592_9BACT|nr:hypothetical protein [Prosthecobacter fusiformis]TDU73049.1 hypothetical protein EI77_01516 [Prosthecobacter fusiformis]
MNSTTIPVAGRPGRMRALLLLGLVFILGAACGIGGGLIFLRGLAQRTWAGETGDKSPVERVTNSIENQMAKELDLTPEERLAVRKEFATTVAQFRALRIKLREDSRSIVEDTLSRLEKQIPEEKRAGLRERADARLRPWGLMPED